MTLSYVDIISRVPDTYVNNAERALARGALPELARWIIAARENFEHLTAEAEQKLKLVELSVIDLGDFALGANCGAMAAFCFGIIYFSRRRFEMSTPSEFEPLAKYAISLGLSGELVQLQSICPTILEKVTPDNCSLPLRIDLLLAAVLNRPKEYIGDFLIGIGIESLFPVDEPVPEDYRPYLAVLFYTAILPLKRDQELDRMMNLIDRVISLTEGSEHELSLARYQECTYFKAAININNDSCE